MKFHGVVGKATGKIPIANSMYPLGFLIFCKIWISFYISSRDSGVIHWMLRSMPNAKNDIPSGQQDTILSSILHSVRDSNPCRNVLVTFNGCSLDVAEKHHNQNKVCDVLLLNVHKTRH